MLIDVSEGASAGMVLFGVGFVSIAAVLAVWFVWLAGRGLWISTAGLKRRRLVGTEVVAWPAIAEIRFLGPGPLGRPGVAVALDSGGALEWPLPASAADVESVRLMAEQLERLRSGIRKA